MKVTGTNPADPPHLYHPEDFDFGLKSGSGAIDRGVALPNITDGFTGRAPDLGALEYGKPQPHYGPEQWPLGVPASGPRSLTGPPHP